MQYHALDKWRGSTFFGVAHIGWLGKSHPNILSFRKPCTGWLELCDMDATTIRPMANSRRRLLIFCTSPIRTVNAPQKLRIGLSDSLAGAEHGAALKNRALAVAAQQVRKRLRSVSWT